MATQITKHIAHQRSSMIHAVTNYIAHQFPSPAAKITCAAGATALVAHACWDLHRALSQYRNRSRMHQQIEQLPQEPPENLYINDNLSAQLMRLHERIHHGGVPLIPTERERLQKKADNYYFGVLSNLGLAEIKITCIYIALKEGSLKPLAVGILISAVQLGEKLIRRMHPKAAPFISHPKAKSIRNIAQCTSLVLYMCGMWYVVYVVGKLKRVI